MEDADGLQEYKLVPLVAGVANVLQLASDWLKPRQPEEEDTTGRELEDMDVIDGVPKGFLEDDLHRDPLGGVPMPGVSREVLYELDMDDDTEAYWCHGINDEGPFRKSARERLGY